MLVACYLASSAWIVFAIILAVAVGFSMIDTPRRGPFMARRRRCRIGDWIVIDARTCGRVTHIGWRFTRLRSADHVEHWVPNRMMKKIMVSDEGSPEAHASSNERCGIPRIRD
ncbi:mechanosensitive ion channel domain-containing protein [Enhygromyxa salina]|uniref:Mechanosensitive ion channel n=1 Tax=Enhygromyxa salina TaxID=215803 RepID=A0A2S9YJE1_9BACT|nr:mechanosensitive ion channel family protein [Enhygromyxa salina]PRQ05228.1 Mechanosensitive ion channel [Enhygromyxa salina]